MKKMLIVDDEEDLTWSLSRGLVKTLPGWTIITENSFHKARLLLKENAFDCLITDFRMQEGDGIELIRTAKKHQTTGLLILMTAYGSADVTQRLSQFPDVVYFEKPFEIEILRELIATWIADPDSTAIRSRKTRSNRRKKRFGPIYS
ncbi:MAG TPA: response regulator [bacterium]|nr:response regulator [bacterium]